MLSSWTLRYSGVNGACCPTPRSLVGSNLNCPPTVPGLMIAFHWPFQLGYFPSLATCALPHLLELQRDMLQRPHQVLDRPGGHPRIERRRIELGVTEQNLDHADVDVLLQEMG